MDPNVPLDDNEFWQNAMNDAFNDYEDEEIDYEAIVKAMINYIDTNIDKVDYILRSLPQMDANSMTVTELQNLQSTANQYVGQKFILGDLRITLSALINRN